MGLELGSPYTSRRDNSTCTELINSDVLKPTYKVALLLTENVPGLITSIEFNEFITVQQHSVWYIV